MIQERTDQTDTNNVLTGWRRVRQSKYYHYFQYLLPFLFTFIISWICLDRDIAELFPKISFLISDCAHPEVNRNATPDVTQSLTPANTITMTETNSTPTTVPYVPRTIFPLPPDFTHIAPSQEKLYKRNTIYSRNNRTTEHLLNSTLETLRMTSVYCYGINTIYRANLALAFFYCSNLVLLMFLGRGFLNHYLLRWVYFLALGAVSMILPAIMIKIYVLLAFLGSLFFIILNVITLIDFTIQVSQYVREHYQSNTSYHCVKISYWISIFLVPALAIVVEIVTLVLFPCAETAILVILNTILMVVVYLQYFWPLFQEGYHDILESNNCLLGCGIIVLYNSYLLLTAFESGASDSCRVISNSSSPFSFGLIFDSLFTVVIILWTSYSIANLHNFLSLTQSDYSQNIFAAREALENNEIQSDDEDTPPTENTGLSSRRDFSSICRSGTTGLFDQYPGPYTEIKIYNDLQTGAYGTNEPIQSGSAHPTSATGVGVNVNSGTCQGALDHFYERELRYWKRLQQMRVYFIVMILATCALLTSMSSWQFYNGHPSVRMDTGRVSMWVKVVTIGITYLGYLSSVIFNRHQRSQQMIRLSLFSRGT